jgi:hypothetical protein
MSFVHARSPVFFVLTDLHLCCKSRNNEKKRIIMPPAALIFISVSFELQKKEGKRRVCAAGHRPTPLTAAPAAPTTNVSTNRPKSTRPGGAAVGRRHSVRAVAAAALATLWRYWLAAHLHVFPRDAFLFASQITTSLFFKNKNHGVASSTSAFLLNPCEQIFFSCLGSKPPAHLPI